MEEGEGHITLRKLLERAASLDTTNGDAGKKKKQGKGTDREIKKMRSCE